jgi:calcium/calmodulin-dependent protein kinase I/MAP/microtubule affinity-regulating kinase
LKGILTGLMNMHQLNYIHRDIKPENIMFTTNNQEFNSENVRIVDFGFSAFSHNNPSKQLNDKIGTLLFMAPELINL